MPALPSLHKHHVSRARCWHFWAFGHFRDHLSQHLPLFAVPPASEQPPEPLLGSGGDFRGFLPFSLAGLGGGSASGKTTVATMIIEALDVPWVVLLSMDSFYKVRQPWP